VSHRVSITSKAEAELYGAAIWWAEHRSQEQGFRWLEGFEAALTSLAEYPERYSLARTLSSLSRSGNWPTAWGASRPIGLCSGFERTK